MVQELLKEIATCENYYWILVLKKVPERTCHYRRVGIGVVWDTPWTDEILKDPKEEFYII